MATRNLTTSSFFTATAEVNLGFRDISNRLRRFEIQKQKTTNLCWAAVAASISTFHDGNNRYSVQCNIVEEKFPGRNCCNRLDSIQCNQPLALQFVLLTTGNFRPPVSGVLRFDQIKNEIDNGCPIAVRIDWRGDSSNVGHFVVIDGYDDTTARGLLSIRDPDPRKESAAYEYNSFRLNYQQKGFWTHTYCTKRRS